MLKNELFQDCPRFQKCNVNNCPLSSRYPDEFIFAGDKEKKCTLAKIIRSRIGADSQLKYRGLTVREYTGLNVWNMKTLEEQEKTKAGIKKYHFASASQIGVVNIV